jgi:SAM-dependent methyltransferase
MEQAELRAILDHDERHWWYRGRLRIVIQEVERLGLPPQAQILDAGCGSGRVLGHLARFGEVAGVDISPLAVRAARERGHEEVLEANIERLPFPSGSFDLVTCLDVIEHTRDDVAVLRELRRVTRPGGRVLLTVPAYPALWSVHDEINHHHRRYLRRELRRVAQTAGLVLERDTHFNALLLPPAAVVRLAGRLRLRRRRATGRSDLSIGPQVINPVLELPLRLEAALLRRGVSLPLGLSVAATYARPMESPGRARQSEPAPARVHQLRARDLSR